MQHKTSADQTALIIGLIAVLIIIIVVLAPLFLIVRVRYRNFQSTQLINTVNCNQPLMSVSKSVRFADTNLAPKPTTYQAQQLAQPQFTNCGEQQLTNGGDLKEWYV